MKMKKIGMIGIAPLFVATMACQPAHADEGDNSQLDVIAVSAEVDNESVIRGRELYTTCIGCHSGDGTGSIGPSLVDNTKDELVSLMKIYASGNEIGPMSGMMIPMVSGLSQQELDDLATYIVSDLAIESE